MGIIYSMFIYIENITNYPLVDGVNKLCELPLSARKNPLPSDQSLDQIQVNFLKIYKKTVTLPKIKSQRCLKKGK
jgi:hypothetical protein